MTLEIFLFLLLAISILTGLVTEAIKLMLELHEKTFSSNVIAGATAVILSVGIDAAYIILTEATINAKLAVYLIALMMLSWLTAMLGYDKVAQTILQIVNAAPKKLK